MKEAFRRWTEDRAFEMSASIAFYAAFSMGPGLLVLSWLVGSVYGVNAAAEIQGLLTELVGTMRPV